MDTYSILLPEASLFRPEGSALYCHQLSTVESLRRGNCVINCSTTGSGKTLGALAYLPDVFGRCAREMDDRWNVTYQFQSVLFISPVNRLINQASNDIMAYLEDNPALEFNVFPINGETLGELKRQYPSKNNGELLQLLFSDPTGIMTPIYATLDKLGFKGVRHRNGRRPFIFVLNPDILYYALFDTYYKFNSRNIINEVLDKVSYVIFDEFSYYDIAQLNSFFVLLSTWKVMGRLETNSVNPVKICLLSATPNELINDVVTNKLGLRIQIITDNDGLDPAMPSTEEAFLSPLALQFHCIEGMAKVNSFEEQMKGQWVVDYCRDQLAKSTWGLIVCNSKLQADRLYRHYNQLFPNQCGRITSGEKGVDRDAAIEYPLLFTTSTVDLGFNFKRKAHPARRQSIDFVFADFVTFDQLVQRIGRCGRILGLDIPKDKVQDSEAHCFVANALYRNIVGTMDAFKAGHPAASRAEHVKALEPLFKSRNYFARFFYKWGNVIAKVYVEKMRQSALAYDPTRVWISKIGEIAGYLHQICNIDADNKRKREQNLGVLYSIIQGRRSGNTRPLVQSYVRNPEYTNADETPTGYDLLVSHYLKKAIIPEDPAMRQDFYRQVPSKIKTFSKTIFESPERVAEFSNNVKGDLAKYRDYLSTLFNQLKSSFRGGLDVNVKIRDPDCLRGSEESEGDFLAVCRDYQYAVSRAGEVTIIKPLLKRRNVEIRLRLQRTRRRDFEQWSESGRTPALRHFLYFKEGELKIDLNDSQAVLPASVEKWQARPQVGYVVRDNWGILVEHGLTYLTPLTLHVFFDQHEEGKYLIFLGRAAFVANAELDRNYCVDEGASE